LTVKTERGEESQIHVTDISLDVKSRLVDRIEVTPVSASVEADSRELDIPVFASVSKSIGR